jgi:hypothetical protein
VAVVGGGHNGLVCAALTALAGLRTVVLERRARPGGATSCAFALHLLHERVAGEVAVELRLRPLGRRVVVLPDGSVHEREDAALWDEVTAELDPFLLREPPRLEELGPVARRYARLTLRRLLEEGYDSAVGRAVNAPPYFAGDPDEPGGPLAYAWLETSRCRDERLQGVPLADPGAAFAAAAEAAGAHVELGREAARIGPGLVELADGRRLQARAVVSTLDPIRTYALAGRPGLGEGLVPMFPLAPTTTTRTSCPFRSPPR